MEIFLDFVFVVRTKKAPKNYFSAKLKYTHPCALHAWIECEVFYCNYIRKTHLSLTEHRCIALSAIISTGRLSEQLSEVSISTKPDLE